MMLDALICEIEESSKNRSGWRLGVATCVLRKLKEVRAMTTHQTETLRRYLIKYAPIEAQRFIEENISPRAIERRDVGIRFEFGQLTGRFLRAIDMHLPEQRITDGMLWPRDRMKYGGPPLKPKPPRHKWVKSGAHLVDHCELCGVYTDETTSEFCKVKE